ncbi:MAG TPA: hypothetical protein VK866_14005 [Acidimicrobiales bacterium]|nr:hypothetical protein [Acidimicrobiales bacterium]
MASPSDLPRRAAELAADTAVVVVGLGVLGVNRVQALRRDLTRRVFPPPAPPQRRRDDEPGV